MYKYCIDRKYVQAIHVSPQVCVCTSATKSTYSCMSRSRPQASIHYSIYQNTYTYIHNNNISRCSSFSRLASVPVKKYYIAAACCCYYARKAVCCASWCRACCCIYIYRLCLLLLLLLSDSYIYERRKHFLPTYIYIAILTVLSWS